VRRAFVRRRLHAAAFEGGVDAAVVLLRAGADVFRVTVLGKTALYIAAERGRTPVAAAILAAARDAGGALRLRQLWAARSAEGLTAEEVARTKRRLDLRTALRPQDVADVADDAPAAGSSGGDDDDPDEAPAAKRLRTDAARGE
jgi:hypothetical protein